MNDRVFRIHMQLAPYPPVQLIYILYRRLFEQGPLALVLWIKDKFDRRIRGLSAPQQSRIVPSLYVGGQHNRRGLAELRSLGIRAVVNMREESDDAARGVDMDAYCWIPTTDDTAPTLEQLQKGVVFISGQIDHGAGVYIHCASGVGRAPTMAAAYLVSQGYTVEQAWESIQRGRIFVRPTPPQIAIINDFAKLHPLKDTQESSTAGSVSDASPTSEDLLQRAVEYIAEDTHLTEDLTDDTAEILLDWAQNQIQTLIRLGESDRLDWDRISPRLSALKSRMRIHARESAVADDPRQILTSRLSADHFAEEDTIDRAV